MRNITQFKKYSNNDIREVILRNLISNNNLFMSANYMSVTDDKLNGVMFGYLFFQKDKRIKDLMTKFFDENKMAIYNVFLFPDFYDKKKNVEHWFMKFGGLEVNEYKYLAESVLDYEEFKKKVIEIHTKKMPLSIYGFNSYETNSILFQIGAKKRYIGKKFVYKILEDLKTLVMEELHNFYKDSKFSNFSTIFKNILPKLSISDLEDMVGKGMGSSIGSSLEHLMDEDDYDFSDELYNFIVDKNMVTSSNTGWLAKSINTEHKNKIKLFKRNLETYPNVLFSYDDEDFDGLDRILTKDEIGKIVDKADISQKRPRVSDKYSSNDTFKILNLIGRKSKIDDQIKEFTSFLKRCKETDSTFSIKRRGVAPQTIDFIYDMSQKKPKSIDSIFESIDDSSKLIIINELRRYCTIGPLLGNIHTSPIVPQKKLSNKDIKNALKYNKFDLNEAVVKVRKLKKENYSDYIDRYVEEAKRSNPLPEQKVQKVKRTEKELAEYTYNMNKKHFAGKHGEIGCQFVEEFDVTFSVDEWEKFRDEWKDKGDGILNPAFHGTNGTAASMIMRFGFAVLSREEVLAAGGKHAGDALGIGVYTAPNIDKISNYVGDENYGRLGQVGYVFLIDETLGQENVHYKVAGIGRGIHNFRSPEYCAKYPREQLKIVKCFKSVKSSLKWISNEAKKHGVDLNEEFEKQIWGNEMLIENEEFEKEEEKLGYTTFIFMDGYVPYNEEDVENFSNLKFGSEIYVGPCQDGIEVVIQNKNGKYDMHKIPDGYHFSAVKGPVFNKFMSMIRGKVKVA